MEHHAHADHPPAQATWAAAAQATLHCLTGCAIGEVLGMVVGTGLGLHNAATVVLSIVLAFVFGYALTIRGVLRAGVGLRTALAVALGLWPLTAVLLLAIGLLYLAGHSGAP